jgi:hypothetical protein
MAAAVREERADRSPPWHAAAIMRTMECTMENQHLLKQDYDASGGCLIRLFWMIVGNALLFLCAMAIAQGTSSWFSPIDALFWIIVGSLLITRYVDIRYFNGMTGDGDAATMADFRRYAVLLAMIAFCLWVGAHVLGAFYSDALPSAHE